MSNPTYFNPDSIKLEDSKNISTSEKNGDYELATNPDAPPGNGLIQNAGHTASRTDEVEVLENEVYNYSTRTGVRPGDPGLDPDGRSPDTAEQVGDVEVLENLEYHTVAEVGHQPIQQV